MSQHGGNLLAAAGESSQPDYLKEISMIVQSGSIAQAKPADVSASNALATLFAAILGLALLFAAGFAETHVLHNAAHDARHSAGFPCH